MANGHGGVRRGAGRKKGQPDRFVRAVRGEASRLARTIADGALKEGITPLEFALKIMRNEALPLQLRCQMAATALPYCHPKLTNTVSPEVPVSNTTINVIAYPPNTSIDRNGIVRLPPPAIEVDAVDVELEPAPEQNRKPN